MLSEKNSNCVIINTDQIFLNEVVEFHIINTWPYFFRKSTLFVETNHQENDTGFAGSSWYQKATEPGKQANANNNNISWYTGVHTCIW